MGDPRLKVFAQLTDHELRRSLEARTGLFIAESEKVVRTALGAQVRPVAFLMEERRVPRLRDCLEAFPEVPAFVLDRDELSQLVGYPHNRGVLCAMERPAARPVEPLLQASSRVAVLEGITDTTNVGAVFRSAAALGVDAVLLTPTCADPLSRRCVRVSMGSVFLVPWARVPSWPEGGIAALHEAGFTVCACALSDDAVALGEGGLRSAPRLAMLFGTEGDGLAARTIAAADVVARIPMAHGVDSLNVAAASAVFFWELCARP